MPSVPGDPCSGENSSLLIPSREKECVLIAHGTTTRLSIETDRNPAHVHAGRHWLQLTSDDWHCGGGVLPPVTRHKEMHALAASGCLNAHILPRPRFRIRSRQATVPNRLFSTCRSTRIERRDVPKRVLILVYVGQGACV